MGETFKTEKIQPRFGKDVPVCSQPSVLGSHWHQETADCAGRPVLLPVLLHRSCVSLEEVVSSL